MCNILNKGGELSNAVTQLWLQYFLVFEFPYGHTDTPGGPLLSKQWLQLSK